MQTGDPWTRALRRHGGHIQGCGGDGDVPFAERRVSDLRTEFVALARQPGRWPTGVPCAAALGLRRRPDTSGWGATPRREGAACRTARGARTAVRSTDGAGDGAGRTAGPAAPSIPPGAPALTAQCCWPAGPGVQPLPAIWPPPVTAILRRHGGRAGPRAGGAASRARGSAPEHPHPNCLVADGLQSGLALRRRAAATRRSPSSTTTRATPSAWPPVANCSAPRPCGPPAGGLPALMGCPTDLPGRQRQSLGQVTRRSLHPAHRLAAPLGHRRQP